jgi:hypothetical protein
LINTYDNDFGVKPSSLASFDTANFTYIQWQDTIKNFGTINEGKPLQIRFKFKNTGTTVLFILETLPSCGCTVTDYPTNPILPGKEGFVTAIVNTFGQHGNIRKWVLIKTNTKTKTLQQLEFYGEVIRTTK